MIAVELNAAGFQVTNESIDESHPRIASTQNIRHDTKSNAAISVSSQSTALP